MFDRIVRNTSRCIQRVEEVLLSASIIGIALLTIMNVVSRSLLDHSLAFAEEVSQFLIIAVCFIGMSYAAAKGRHIRMTAVFDQLSLRMRKRLMLIITGCTSLLMATFGVYACAYVYHVALLGGRYPALGVPYYVVYSIVPLGFFLAAIQYALALVRNLQVPQLHLSYEHVDEDAHGKSTANPSPDAAEGT